jgi:hypothetical protein
VSIGQQTTSLHFFVLPALASQPESSAGSSYCSTKVNHVFRSSGHVLAIYHFSRTAIGRRAWETNHAGPLHQGSILMPDLDAEIIFALVVVCVIALGFGVLTVLDASYRDAVSIDWC